MGDDKLAQLHTQLLVTLAQAVLVMHQTQYVPTRLREQLARQVGELEALTERYAAMRDAEARHYRLGPYKTAPALKLVPPEEPPDHPAA